MNICMYAIIAQIKKALLWKKDLLKENFLNG